MSNGNIETLRSLRAWHYAQALELRCQGEVIDRRVATARNDSARSAYEKASTSFHKRANEHLRFVQQLNEFFPATDRVM